MKIILFAIINLFLFTNIFAQNDLKKLVGAYQYCSFPCETIRLNEDFTFDYLLDGDLFNNERTKGIWKFIGKDKIYLKSPERSLVYRTLEKQTKDFDKILIQATDMQGAALPGIIVKVNFQGQEKQFVTDENGNSEIPKVNSVEIVWTRFSEKYVLKDSHTNELNIEVDITNEPFVDDTFILKNNQLYKVFEDNSISENGYEKLNKRRIARLFPKK